MKKVNIIFLLLMFTFNISNAQITAKIDQVFMNNQTTINLCNTIDFGTTQSNTLLFYYTLTKGSSQAVGDGNVKIYLKYSPTSNPIQKGPTITILSSSWSSTQRTGTISCPIDASEVQVTGSSVYIEFSNGSSAYQSCGNPIIKTPLPTFTLNTTSL
jgi:hypothetical protein